MKSVEWTDEEGKTRISIVRSDDSVISIDEGISVEPPPIDDILEEAKIELHNELVKRGVFEFKDLGKSPGALEGAVARVVTRKIILRYKEVEYNNNKE
jgi:hypothetical protein